MTRFLTRTVFATLSSLALSALLVSPAVAKNGVSLGKGVKCTWVLVSSVGSNNTYTQVCRRGP
jgi:hypothetical protein